MKEGQQLKEVGLKVTSARLKVLQILEKSQDRHLSAEDVYKGLLEKEEDVGLATVYRVLAQFEEAGLIQRHNFDETYSVYELNQAEHHDHLVCLQCGKVEEFMDPIIEERQKLIAEQAKFKMRDHSLIIYGDCENCTIKES